MLFRPFRLFLFLGIAFIAGIVYEKQSDAEACDVKGGQMVQGLCEVRK